MQKHVGLYVVAALALAASACQKVERVEVAPKSLLFTSKGQTATVTATAFDAEGKALEGVELVYESSDPAIATVDAKGTVTALKSGVAQINAKAKEKAGTAQADVRIPAKLSLAAPVSITGIGSTAALDAKVLDENDKAIDGAAVNFQIADTSIALVAGNTVTAVAPGATKITASFGALTQDVDVAVALPEFASVSLEPATSTVKAGESVTLTAMVKNAEGGAVAGVPVTFASSDEKLATVDAAGKVTAVAAGKAKITATAGDKAATVDLVIKK